MTGANGGAIILRASVIVLYKISEHQDRPLEPSSPQRLHNVSDRVSDGKGSTVGEIFSLGIHILYTTFVSVSTVIVVDGGVYSLYAFHIHAPDQCLKIAQNSRGVLIVG